MSGVIVPILRFASGVVDHLARLAYDPTLGRIRVRRPDGVVKTVAWTSDVTSGGAPAAHQSSHRVGGSDALPAGDASTAGLLKLGAAGGAQTYSVGAAAVAVVVDAATKPNNAWWGVHPTDAGGWTWSPRVVPGFPFWHTQVTYGASDTWATVGQDVGGATAYTQVGSNATGGGSGLRVTTLTTTAVSGNVASFRSNGNVSCARETTVAVVTGLFPATITSARIWLGFMSSGTAATMGGADAPASTTMIGLLRSTSASNTNLWIVESDASNSLSTDTGVTIAAGDAYQVAFSWNSAKTAIQVWISVNFGAWTCIGTASTYLPAAGTLMAIGMSTTTLSAATRTCRGNCAWVGRQ